MFLAPILPLLVFCRVSHTEAAGRLSAELLCPYPPGVPVAVPGEVLQQDVILQLLDVLESGGAVTGASDSTLASFLVLEENDKSRS